MADLDPIQDALKKLNKELGENSIMEGIDSGSLSNVDAISTCSLALDAALGIGGIPRGRITEIFGPEASGKSTLALHLVADVQSKGGRAVYIDVEHAVDTAYARSLGVDTDTLLFSQPDSGEQAFKIIEGMAKTGKVDVVVVDSVAALATQQELDGEVDDHNIAGTARLMSKGIKRIISTIHGNNVALIFINQLRQKIGGFGHGPNEVTPGGKALKYYSSIRIDIRRIGGLKRKSTDTEFCGNKVRAKIVKNKVAPPFRVAEFDIIFGEGISSIGSILDLAEEHKIVKKTGSNYYYEDNRIGNSRNNTIKALEEDSDLLAVLDKNVRKIILPHLYDGEKDVKE